ncbi:hypothetical protein SEA_XIMENITA_92 [Mycobacterium phage Ximenita]|uniref:Uncharacterized protein n=1 Tax=Mycobacterium phage Ximenita TaxID=2708633 RepID=A0A6G6XS33_9CAUD|nr:hypothetical protein I5G82_gp015 [Mycobacterium phage Ximenita]QIG61600.1 hypothetical protein SEA_XIMENITA_92 [Mycobacterium phage Ximenita]
MSMSMPTLTVLAADRQHGKTTALLDVALANARRGLDVAFWSPRAVQSEYAFRLATRLVTSESIDAQAVFSAANGREAIRYPSGGRVRFAWGHAGRCPDPLTDMTIRDDDGEGTVTRDDRKRKGQF